MSDYVIDLDLRDPVETFESTTTVRFTAAAAEPTFLEVEPRALHHARLNGADLPAEAFDNGRLVFTPAAGENELVVSATMEYSNSGEGLHRHVDAADGQTYLYAMSAMTVGPRWYACFDQPDLKARIAVRAVTPTDWIVRGNGHAERTGDGRWSIAATEPMSTYLATIVAGPYHAVEGEHDGVPMSLLCRASLGEFLDRQAPGLLEFTGRCLDEFHRLFGIRYPWGEYHQAFVPEFNALAMENSGCITFRDQFVFRSQATPAEEAFLRTVISHEMAHQWFGNLVTMKWWDDMWLNESFAEYLGYRVCDAVNDVSPWPDFSSKRKAWGYAADRRPTTHPVAGNGAPDAASARENFDGISYAKGASALKQLAARMGDDRFLGGLRNYFNAYAYGNAEFADLISAWTAAGAEGLPGWAQAWLLEAGVDTLSVEQGAIVRRGPGGADSPREHAVSIGAFDGSGSLLGRTPVTIAANRTEVDVAGPAALVLADVDDDTWAKIALTPAEWEALPSFMSALPSVSRVVIWNGLRMSVQDGELDPEIAARLTIAALPDEDDSAVLADTLGRALVLFGEYQSTAGYRRTTAALADRFLPVASTKGPRQLESARAWIACSYDAERLRSWLGGDVPDGLAVDTGLRWRLVQRLATLGELGPDEVQAEAERDRTSEGEVQAAKAAALIPRAETKEASYRTLMHDPAAANHTLYAVAEAFFHPLHAEVTAPFVDRFFADVVGTSLIRSGWVVARTARIAYPTTAVTEHAVGLVDRLLAEETMESPLRRELTDGADDVRRALASRVRFGN